MIKRILYKLLGPAAYLRVVSRTFFFALSGGWLRNQPAFYNHYMIEKLIREGDHVIDIGANLGYYTVLFADHCGEKGKVWAVEPVELFRKVLQRNLGQRAHVVILPFALGDQDGLEIEMGIPSGHKNFRHGLTHVLEKGEKEASTMIFRATMRHPMNLFTSIERLDYIKCDVEGYEVNILPLMRPLFEKFHPILQLETGGENRKIMLDMFTGLGYEVYAAGAEKLERLEGAAILRHEGDLLFIPSLRKTYLTNIIEA